MTNARLPGDGRVRWAVVGLGHIAQAAVLPAFANARRNARLTALISDDPKKLRKLGRRHRVALAAGYDEYDEALRTGVFDAVYLALPNALHADFTVRAARAGIHVLCEKPLAMTEAEGATMIDECAANHVKLMVAYRLHLEAANLEAVELARAGKIGEPRLFSSVFCMQVRRGDIRLSGELTGGPLYDIGVYPINAARHLFDAEPIEVFAYAARGGDPRFSEVDEATVAVLRFPGDRLAQIACSFGAHDVSAYRLVGTRGQLRLEPAYSYTRPLVRELRIGDRARVRRYPVRDQFGPELGYFSDCVLEDREPAPSGVEGLADVRIIRALLRSAEIGQPVALPPLARAHRPATARRIERPAVAEPDLVHAESPHG